MSEVDRNSYIGGPDAGTIANVSPWDTPVALWNRKTRRHPPTELNAAMRSGQLLEPALLVFASEELGWTVQPGPFVRDPRDPLGGHLDGIKDDGTEGVEGKTVRRRNGWGEPGTDQVPPHVAAQCFHYMGLMPQMRVMHIPVLFSGLDFALYRVERDDGMIAALRELCVNWWRQYVETDTPPPPTTGNDAALLFPRDSGRVVVADDATAAAYAELLTLRARMKADDDRRDELESRLKLALGDASALTVDGKTAATWKASTSNRFDATAFKAAHADLYQQFTRPSESRRFLVKEV